MPGIALVDRVLRPEVVATAVVVLGAASLPFLLPVTDLLADLRDAIVRSLGLNTITLLLFLGMLLVARRFPALGVRPRHALGAFAMLVFTAGVFATWAPNVLIGHVDLHVVSAGGSAGRSLVGWPGALPWLGSFFAGFALLWPDTAAEIARTAPGAAARGSIAALRWTWSSIVVPGFGATRSAVALVRRRDDADSEYDYDDEEWLAEEESEAAVEVLPAPRARAAVQADAPWPGTGPVKRQIPMELDQPVGAWRHSADGWQLPSLDLLQNVKVQSKQRQADTQRRAQLIVDTLASFGVDARVIEVNEGPTVTQFGVEPGWDVRTRTVQERDTEGNLIYDADGQPRTREVEMARTRIRVSRITALQNDLALALAAPALRIEAPVPGKPIVGIEVPNSSSSVVTMKQLLASSAYQRFAAKASLPVALGAGVSGEPVLADLAKMPHLLIAGATGAGKSVCLNAIITGLLMHFSPNELRMVLIDPKRVEMTPYAKIPHLAFSQIVVDMDKVVGTLQAVINEMESRYRRFAQAGVRDLRRYNELAEKSGAVKLPYWVVIIDELADLMLAAPYQVETQIVRLAQLARATGIHLIIATQRPSVDVVTGLIKANFPTRIAFAMSSQVDSRTVLDHGGAEKLLGRGDMLFVPPDEQKPKRVQGAFLSDAEIEAVVGFWTSDRFSELVPDKHDELLAQAEAQLQGAAEAADGPDPMVEKAVALAKELKTISTSMLQRRLRIGYPRAARIMDELEDRGFVGPSDGSSSREVLVSNMIEAGDAAGGSAPAEASAEDAAAGATLEVGALAGA